VLMHPDNRGVDHLHRRIMAAASAFMMRPQTPARRQRTKRL
jgi:hypothetical protein